MKRFTDTSKWIDPWYRRLSPTAKLLWSYLTDNCDCTGLIDLDIESASFHIGTNIQEKHLSELESRTQRTPDGKLFITAFICFQYGTLSESCPAHKPVIKLVHERNLNRNGKGYQYPNANLELPERVAVGYSYPTRKEKDKKGKEKEEGTREKRPKDVLDCIAYCREQGLTEADGQWLWDKWVGNGFTNGGKPMNDWKSTARSWKAQGYFPSQKNSSQSKFGKPQRPSRQTEAELWYDKTYGKTQRDG